MVYEILFLALLVHFLRLLFGSFLFSLSPFVLYDQIINTKLCLLVESLHELQSCPSLSQSVSSIASNNNYDNDMQRKELDSV